MKRVSSNLIFEELSISNEVLNVGKDIENLILQHLETVEKTVKRKEFTPTYQEQNDMIKMEEKVFDIFDKIQINVKYFANQKEIKDVFYSMGFGGAIDEESSILILDIYGINDKIDITFLRSTLNHELKHAFQISMNKSFEIDELYKKAINVLQHRFKYSAFLVNLSNLIYFFNKKEIDANMESLYQDLKNGNNNSSVLNEFELSQEIYYDLKDYLFDDDIKNTTQEVFHKTLKEILYYIKNNIEYFKIKKRKVLGRIHNERSLNELYKLGFKRFLK